MSTAPFTSMSTTRHGAAPKAAQHSQGMPFSSAQHTRQPMGTLSPGTKVFVGPVVVTVQRYLSQGGFAHVYLVTTDKPISVPVSATTIPGGTAVTTRGETLHVLKRMAVPDKESLASVRNEVEIHKSIRAHPNIVHFVEASASALQGGGYEIFILMEYCSGGGIIDLMNSRLRTRLSEAEVLKIFGDVAAGLKVMHSMDPPIMHRDLKVENILLSPPPPSNPRIGPTYKLCDFGSSKALLTRRAPRSLEEVKRLEADLNKHTTLQYRAPEMVDVYQRRPIDEKADIWAMGVLLYKLCYYTTPFEENGGGPLAILNARYRFPQMPPYSQRLKDLISSMLQEHSHLRPNIDEVIVRLHRILGSEPPSSSLHSVQGNKNTTDSFASSSSTVQTSEGSNGAAAGVNNDLIAIGPTEEERKKVESEEMRRRNENITPMRRGRPNKSTVPGKTLPEAKPDVSSSIVESDSQLHSKGNTSDKLDFADSFSPHSNGSTADSLPASRPPSTLQHSPSLPGFDSALASRGASPLPQRLIPSPSALGKTLPETNRSSHEVQKESNQYSSSRFPSIDEIDRHYSNDRNRSPLSVPPKSDSQPVRSPVSNIPGLSNRSSVSAMAGKFSGMSSASNTGSDQGKRDKRSLTSTTMSGSTAQGSSSPHNHADPQLVAKPFERPSLPSRKQMHKDWLPPNVIDRTVPLKATDKYSRQTDTTQLEKTDKSEVDSSDDDVVPPEDLDATRRRRPVTMNIAASYEEKLRATAGTTESTKDTVRPGKIKIPPWNQSNEAEEEHVSTIQTSDSSITSKVETPHGNTSKDVNLLDVDPGLTSAPKSSEADPLERTLDNMQKATPPAWDEDDEEMHFLPQPTIGVDKNDLTARGASANLQEHDNATDMPTVLQIRKQYADAATSPRQMTPEAQEAVEDKQASSQSSSQNDSRPIVPPKAMQENHTREVENLVSSFGGVNLRQGRIAKPTPPIKPGSIRGRQRTFESEIPVIHGQSQEAPSISREYAASTELPQQTKRKAPVVAAKPLGIHSRREDMKPWEREEEEKQRVEKYGALRASSPSKTGGETKPPSEAQERFRGVSSLINQWQANAAKGAPGWGTVGTEHKGGGKEHHDEDVLSQRREQRQTRITSREI